MEISFVAGFGPITRDAGAARAFWEEGLGIALEEPAPGYLTNDSLEGVKAFALWPLSQAAESTFGSAQWPADLPTPQAWIEFDVASADAVVAGVAELVAKGHQLLRDTTEEPWGQTTSRLLSPEGLLVGVTYTPWLHAPAVSP
ncbi:glyoxalase/bleomycin resistance/dioxygenase family protein [Cellulomonas sp. URHE0023]|uniref:glyoxalase/bleomycin resistance/dioxygenase family protein n=1 Tax=Cellulomonas sp. URHE0023 TaxID=1380354 RepID=UPI0004870D72|nr:glyoxalase/bleomycin resistance/dioxygenase family protein [Cellulomonas sp. URHE0023]